MSSPGFHDRWDDIFFICSRLTYGMLTLGCPPARIPFQDARQPGFRYRISAVRILLQNTCCPDPATGYLLYLKLCRASGQYLLMWTFSKGSMSRDVSCGSFSGMPSDRIASSLYSEGT